MIDSSRSRLGKGIRTVAGGLGFDLVRRHYHSPVPDLRSLPPETWTRKSDLPGVRWPADAGLSFLREELASHIAEYRPPRNPTGSPRDFYLDNPAPYRSVDAETLYAMIRRFKPKRVLELGSGFSSLVIADARERNGDSDPAGHVIYDPFPRPELRPALERVGTLRTVSAAELGTGEHGALGANDLLFVDTSHVVKVNSEVNHVFLEVLPVLPRGVLVHIHDIFLPYEYPRIMAASNLFFNEQYLLQALLVSNPEFEVLFGAFALHRDHAPELAQLVPGLDPDGAPAAFWLRKTGA